MIDPTLDRLIDEVLEGTASPADAARLDAAMARDPELRARHDALAETMRTLAHVREADPPSDLRTVVMRDVRAHAAHRSATGWGARLAATLGGRRGMVLFAGGLAALAIAFVGTRGWIAPSRDGSAVGTIGAATDVSRRMTLGGYELQVRMPRQDSGADFAVAPDGPGTLTITWPAERGRMTWATRGLGSARLDVSDAPGRVTVTVRDRERFQLSLIPEAHTASVPVQLEVRTAGGVFRTAFDVRVSGTD